MDAPCNPPAGLALNVPVGLEKEFMFPILFDGAFGTYYEGDSPCEWANLRAPQGVLAVHSAYLAAGAGAIKTNTFGVNDDLTPDASAQHQLIAAGFALASRAAADFAARQAAVGFASAPQAAADFAPAEDSPTGFAATDETVADFAPTRATAASFVAAVYADIGPVAQEDAAAQYLRLAQAFLDAGATHFLFETQASAAPLATAMAHIRAALPGAEILVSFAVSQDGYSQAGVHYRALFLQAAAQGADAVGLNCRCGPAHMQTLLADAAGLGIATCNGAPIPLLGMPNAGYPENRSGRMHYHDNPQYFATHCRAMADSGVAYIGGCCGTTPAHIAAARALLGLGADSPSKETPGSNPDARLSEKSSAAPKATMPTAPPSAQNPAPPPTPAEHRAPLPTDEGSAPPPSSTASRAPSSPAPARMPSPSPAQGVASSSPPAPARASSPLPVQNQASFSSSTGRPLIAVEVAAPLDADPTHCLHAAQSAKDSGADFITIPDSPLARARASSVATAAFLQARAGIPAIPHLCCRDRNPIALKGDLLAGHMQGLRHALCITGDPVAEAGRAQARNVYHLNAFDLLNFASHLNTEAFFGSPYELGGALNINATNFEVELDRARRKRDCGAVALFTQPAFDAEHVRRIEQAHALGMRIFAGILPLAGYKNAVFLHHEVPGMRIPLDLLADLENLEPAAAAAVCLDFARTVTDQLLGVANAFYVITPLKKIALSQAVVRHIRGG